MSQTHMEGSYKEGQSQEVQVSIHKDPFNLIGILLRETWNTGYKYGMDLRLKHV